MTSRVRSRTAQAEVFSDFVAARSPSLLRTAYLLVGDRGLAHDLLQEALTRTWAAWGRIKDPQKAEAYARRALTHTAISWYRRRSWNSERPAEVLPDFPSPGHEDRLADGVVAKEHLWRALQELPPRQRVAVVCRFYDDLSEAETARVMGCAVGTVKSQVHAGLSKLRDALPDLDASLPTPSRLQEMLR